MALKTREEHLEWCKQRAIALVELGDIIEALQSLQSDFGKHTGTIELKETLFDLTWPLFFAGHLDNKEAAIKHINGFR